MRSMFAKRERFEAVSVVLPDDSPPSTRDPRDPRDSRDPEADGTPRMDHPLAALAPLSRVQVKSVAGAPGAVRLSAPPPPQRTLYKPVKIVRQRPFEPKAPKLSYVAQSAYTPYSLHPTLPPHPPNPPHQPHPTHPPHPPHPSSNRALTAQILQSLSRPRHAAPQLAALPRPSLYRLDCSFSRKTFDQRRHVRGDHDVGSPSEAVPGVDDRPPTPQETLSRYRCNQHSVMLDHTYATCVRVPSDDAVLTPVEVAVNGTSPSVPVPSEPPPPPTVETPRSPERCPVPTSAPPPSPAVTLRPEYARETVPLDDDCASSISSADGDGPDGRPERRDSDTETAPEVEEEGKTRCVCEFTHDDGYMICCDRCGEWQHVDCMGIDRQNIPDDYMCDRCEPRPIDRKRARSVQIRKREELKGLGSSGSDSSSGLSLAARGPVRRPVGVPPVANRKRPLTVTTYSNTVGGVSRTVSSLSSFSGPPFVPTEPSTSQTKRGPKRPRRPDAGRKTGKRKFPERRKRRPGEVSGHRPKHSHPPQRNRWADSYELAMTNHYSPELRAKVTRHCNNRGTVECPDAPDVPTVHLCTTVPHAGGKILIATRDVKENSPIIELRGKYMLSAQHRPQPQSGRTGGQKPGPFLFFYSLPENNIQICIDTRTYGNEARFVRRSCKPNAELRHCIIKGALHVYIVTVAPVQSNTEISIPHEPDGGPHSCACANPKRCGQNAPLPDRGARSPSDDRPDRRGRTRLSSSSSSPAAVPDDFKVETAVRVKSEPDCRPHPEPGPVSGTDEELPGAAERARAPDTPESDIKSEDERSPILKIKEEPIDVASPVKFPESMLAEVKEIKSEGYMSDTKIGNLPKSMDCSLTCKVKEEKSKKTTRRSSAQSVRTTRASLHSVAAAGESADEKSDNQCDSRSETKSDEKRKMTREERKMEAIMKAFERLEKAELRKQENRDKQIKRRESDSQPSNIDKELQNDDDDYSESPNIKKRRKKKGRTRTTSQNHQRNRNRLNSVDSDLLTSGEESTSLLSPPFNSCNMSNDALMDTNVTSEDSSAFQEPLSDSLQLQQSVQRLNVGLSSACLLVEAAVGPLESTFKFPKTKKDRMNEWLNKSPERNSTFDLNHSYNYSNATDNNNMSNYSDKKLFMGGKFENLMKAANTMIGNFSGGSISASSTPEKTSVDEISRSVSASPFSPSRTGKKSDSETKDNTDRRTNKRYRKGCKITEDYPFKRTLRSNSEIVNNVPYGDFTPPHDNSFVGTINREIRDHDTNAVSHPLQHSAKKRWLRQAISEESDSPTAESPPSEMLTPLKKRRLARESLSLEPPSSGNCEESQNSIMVKTPEKQDTIDDFTSDSSSIHFQPMIVNDKDSINSEVLLSVDSNRVPSPDIKDHSQSTEQSTALEKDKNETVQTPSPAKKSDNSDIVKDNFQMIDDGDNSSRSPLRENCSNPDLKSDFSLEEVIGVDSMSLTSVNCDIKVEQTNNVPSSADTSGTSSPVLDDMDDIKKKIHSFHTENIQILKIRNKKQLKENRKKVNLNFDLCVLADQTIGVKLKSESDGQDVDASKSNKSIEEPVPEKVNLPTSIEDIDLSKISLPPEICPVVNTPNKLHINDSECGSNFGNSPSFLTTFRDESNNRTGQMPDLNVIKNAIDMTTSLDIGLKSTTTLNSTDEYRNVQEILSRVNQMDSHNSLLLSGVLKDSTHSSPPDFSTGVLSKTFTPRANDPRLHPPPADKPKPVRRKLSITEYRRRHSMVSSSTEQGSSAENDSASCTPKSENSPIDTAESLKSEILPKTESTCIESLLDSKDKTAHLLNNSVSIIEKSLICDSELIAKGESLRIGSETTEATDDKTRRQDGVSNR